MGTFNVPIAIGDPQRERWTALDALVDSGASITSVTGSLLRGYGVVPIMRQAFEFGHGEVRTMDVGQTWLRIDGREIITHVLFNDEGTLPLLGALALEGLFLGIDPVAQRLIPVRGLIA